MKQKWVNGIYSLTKAMLFTAANSQDVMVTKYTRTTKDSGIDERELEIFPIHDMLVTKRRVGHISTWVWNILHMGE